MRVFFVVFLFFSLVLSSEKKKKEDLLLSLVESCLALERGLWVTHFNVTHDDKGLVMRASRNMTAGEIVFEIPFSLHFNWQKVSSFLPRNVTSVDIDRQMLVAVYLAFERFQILPRKEKPKWWDISSYFSLFREPLSLLGVWADMMPDHVDNAAYWTTEDWKEARSLAYFPETINIDDAWKKLKPSNVLTEEQLRWGYSMLLSRTFADIEGAAIAVPLADLFNHDYDPNVGVSIDKVKMFLYSSLDST